MMSKLDLILLRFDFGLLRLNARHHRRPVLGLSCRRKRFHILKIFHEFPNPRTKPIQVTQFTARIAYHRYLDVLYKLHQD